MSDRNLCVVHIRRLTMVFAVAMVLAAGCERTRTVSQPAIETAVIADSGPAGQPVKSAEEPLLLLDDEPEGDESGEPTADNSRCFVCHVNYMDEEIAVTHARRNIGCAHCHGPSDEHIADESWASGGNGTAPDIMFPSEKVIPSCMACHDKSRINIPQHDPALTDGGKKLCTHCHGNHRLPQRRCTWK